VESASLANAPGALLHYFLGVYGDVHVLVGFVELLRFLHLVVEPRFLVVFGF